MIKNTNKIIQSNKFDEITNRLDQLTNMQNEHLKISSSRSVPKNQEPIKLIREATILDAKDIVPKKLTYSSSSSSSIESLIKQLSDKEDQIKSPNKKFEKKPLDSASSTSLSPVKLKTTPDIKKGSPAVTKSQQSSIIKPIKNIEAEENSYDDDFDDVKDQKSFSSSTSSN